MNAELVRGTPATVASESEELSGEGESDELSGAGVRGGGAAALMGTACLIRTALCRAIATDTRE